MVFQVPMQLFHNKELFGTIATYSYETPWATGRFVAQDRAQHERCVAVCSFLEWVEGLPDSLSDEDSDEQYNQALIRYGLSEEDVSRYSLGGWSIVTNDGEECSVYSLFFFDDGFIQWRW